MLLSLDDALAALCGRNAARRRPTASLTHQPSYPPQMLAVSRPRRAHSLAALASCSSEALSMLAAHYACHNLFAHAAVALAKLTFCVPFARRALTGIGQVITVLFLSFLACRPAASYWRVWQVHETNERDFFPP